MNSTASLRNLLIASACNPDRPPGPAMPDKPSLRLHLREVLACLPEGTKSAASIKLCARIRALPVFQQARVIALFHPTKTEPDLLPLLPSPDKLFLFPLCHPNRSLTWHPAGHPDQWKAGRFGIIEPNPELDQAVPQPNFDLVLVPGLAFARGGDRLGHGAGYYDHFLASLPPSSFTIGICFDCQFRTSLPAEPHDIPVHQVLHA